MKGIWLQNIFWYMYTFMVDSAAICIIFSIYVVWFSIYSNMISSQISHSFYIIDDVFAILLNCLVYLLNGPQTLLFFCLICFSYSIQHGTCRLVLVLSLFLWRLRQERDAPILVMLSRSTLKTTTLTMWYALET